MQNDTLMALLLDPFLTYEEAVKQLRPVQAGAPSRSAAPPTARRVFRQPTRPRSAVRPEPVVHHPPVIAG